MLVQVPAITVQTVFFFSIYTNRLPLQIAHTHCSSAFCPSLRSTTRWRYKRQHIHLRCSASSDIFILRTPKPEPGGHGYVATDEECRLRLQSRGITATVVDTVPETRPHYRRAPDPTRSKQPHR